MAGKWKASDFQDGSSNNNNIGAGKWKASDFANDNIGEPKNLITDAFETLGKKTPQVASSPVAHEKTVINTARPANNIMKTAFNTLNKPKAKVAIAPTQTMTTAKKADAPRVTAPKQIDTLAIIDPMAAARRDFEKNKNLQEPHRTWTYVDNATISEYKPSFKEKIRDVLSEVNKKVKAFGYGAGEAVGVKLLSRIVTGKNLDTEENFNLYMGENPNKKLDGSTYTAKHVGSFAGEVLKMIGIGKLAEEAVMVSGIGKELAQKIAARTLTGMGLGAESTYEEGGKAIDYLKNMASSTAFMNLGGAASDVMGNAGLKVLQNAPNAVKNSLGADLALKGAKGAAFGVGGSVGTIPFNGIPSKEEFLTNVVTGALFETIPGAIESVRTSKASKGVLNEFVNRFKGQYEEMVKSKAQVNDPVVNAKFHDTLIEQAKGMKEELNKKRFVGQNKKVNEVNQMLDTFVEVMEKQKAGAWNRSKPQSAGLGAPMEAGISAPGEAAKPSYQNEVEAAAVNKPTAEQAPKAMVQTTKHGEVEVLGNEIKNNVEHIRFVDSKGAEHIQPRDEFEAMMIVPEEQNLQQTNENVVESREDVFNKEHQNIKNVIEQSKKPLETHIEEAKSELAKIKNKNSDEYMIAEDRLWFLNRLMEQRGEVKPSERTMTSVADKKVKPMSADETLKPHIQEEASQMLTMLKNGTKAERVPIRGEDGYISGWTGTSRDMGVIGEIRDITGASYSSIERSLNAIIEGKVKNNNHVAKKIELIIHKRLMEGYKDNFWTGKDIPRNEKYVEAVAKLEGTEYKPQNNTQLEVAKVESDGAVTDAEREMFDDIIKSNDFERVASFSEYQQAQFKEYLNQNNGKKQWTAADFEGKEVESSERSQEGSTYTGGTGGERRVLSSEGTGKKNDEGNGDNRLGASQATEKVGLNTSKIRPEKIVEPRGAFQNSIVRLMEKLGVKVKFFADDPNIIHNGFYEGGNVLYVRATDNDPNLLMATTGHEFLHSVKENYPEIFDDLLEFGKTSFSDDEKSEFLKGFEHVPVLQDELANDEEKLVEEMLADELGNNFLNKDFWSRLYESAKDLFEKLVSIAKELLNKFKAEEYVNFIDKTTSEKLTSKFEEMIQIIRNDVKNKETPKPSKEELMKQINEAWSEVKQTSNEVPDSWQFTKDDPEVMAKVDKWQNASDKLSKLEDEYRSLYMQNDAQYSVRKKAVGEPIGQIETEAFKDWFGDSKAVDDTGAPMVMYHGTQDGNMTTFDDGRMVWLSESKDYSSKYAAKNGAVGKYLQPKQYSKDKSKLIPSYVKVENPLDLGNTHNGYWNQEWDKNQFYAKSKLNRVEVDKIARKLNPYRTWELTKSKEFMDYLKSKGYDGIIGEEYGNKVVAAFSPTQIKSAIANNGEFDSDNPDIRYSIRRKETQHRYEMREQAKNDVELKSPKWKDKAAFGYQNDTAARNFEKTMGKDAKEMVERYISPIHEHVAEGIRLKKRIFREIAALNIKTTLKDKKVVLRSIEKMTGKPMTFDESALAQIYGEKELVTVENVIDPATGKKGKTVVKVPYTIDDLKRDVPNEAKRNKIIQAAEYGRKTYDELLDMLNQARTRNGYPPVKKLDNYFLHMKVIGDLFENFKDELSINDLPTQINGITADFKPGKNFFASADLHRLGLLTEYDFVNGLKKYVNGVTGQIYLTDDITRLRSLEDSLRGKYSDDHLTDIRNAMASIADDIKEIENSIDMFGDEKEDKIKALKDKSESIEHEIDSLRSLGNTHLSNFTSWLSDYVNNLAGKKAFIDRGVEITFGRKAYSVLNTITNQVGRNMTGYNIGSALTNFIPIGTSIAETSKPAYFKGAVDTAMNIFKSDGFMEKSDFLTSRLHDPDLLQSVMDYVTTAGYIPMKVIDWVTSNLVVRGKYHEFIDQGFSEDEAIQKADDFARRVMAGRAKGEMPTLYNSKLIKLLTQFQLEVNNQYYHMFGDVFKTDYASDKKKGFTKEYAESNPKAYNVAMAMFKFVQIIAFTYLMNLLYKQLTGRKPAFDTADITIKFANNMMNNPDKAAGVLFQDLAKNTPYIGSYLGGGRIPMSAAIPDFAGLAKGTATSEKEFKKLGYLFFPSGFGQFNKTKDGLGMFDNDLTGLYGQTKSGEKYLKYPVDDTVGNRFKAAVLGPYATSASEDYFNGDIQALSPKETKALEAMKNKGEDYKGAYSDMMGAKKLEDGINELKNLAKKIALSDASELDKKMRLTAVQAQMRELVEEYNSKKK